MSLAFCSDQPITTVAQDAFGFYTYAEKLCRLALIGDSPLTIGVFGPAGCGKTSLLHLIVTALEKQSKAENHPILILWFDAAQHVRTASTIPQALLLQALATFKSLDLAPEDTQQLTDWETHLTTATDLGALADTFPATFARWINDFVTAREGRLVIFIDGLDGCPAECALDVLETARHFLSVRGSLCFLATDHDRLNASLNARYGAPATEANAVPDIHTPCLDRLVQVTFTLPPLLAAHSDAFLAHLAPDLPNEACHVLAVGLPPNPRHLKRGLNALRLRQALAQPVQGEMEALNPILLAKIVVLQERYPELNAVLAEHPCLLQELELHIRNPQPTSNGAALPGTKSLPLPLARYAADPVLTRVLGTAGPITTSFAHLAPHELHACLGLVGCARDPDRQVWDDLLSGNIAHLQAAVEIARQCQPAYSYALVRFMHREQPASIAQRLSAGLALGRLGDPRDFTETVIIAAGDFLCGEEKQPRALSAYRIGRYPVTQAQYAEFLQANPEIPAPYIDEDWARVYNWDPEKRTYPEGRSNQPVVLITWDEAVAYCTWAGGRLPTEEEWERAARGTDGRNYPWGESFNLVRANTRESGLGGPTPVGIFVEGESPSGVLDMAGNVWEWTANGHDENTEILRGGAWSFPAESAQTYVSERSLPHNRSHAIGFRVVFPLT
jgi:hypothetical protein